MWVQVRTKVKYVNTKVKLSFVDSYPEMYELFIDNCKIIKGHILPCHFLLFLLICCGLLNVLHIDITQFCRSPFFSTKMFVILRLALLLSFYFLLSLMTACFFRHSPGLFLFLSPYLFPVNYAKVINVFSKYLDRNLQQYVTTPIKQKSSVI